jgi:hypothetical protein
MRPGIQIVGGKGRVPYRWHTARLRSPGSECRTALARLAPLLRDLLERPGPGVSLGDGVARLAELADAEVRSGPNRPSPAEESAPKSRFSVSGVNRLKTGTYKGNVDLQLITHQFHSGGAQLLGRSQRSRPLVITPCTSRKRQPPQVSVSAMLPGTQQELCRAWLRAIRKVNPESCAEDLYSGRAFGLAKQAARILGADFAIASAGLGMVMSSTKVPSYNLTISRGGLTDKLTSSFDPVKWWRTISKGPYAIDFDAVLRNRPLVLVCLSRAYAPLFQEALESVPTDRLRIFGAGLGYVLPTSLRPCVLPYDLRLDAGTPGTRGDFAQRALLHYVRVIHGVHTMSIDDERAAVLAELAKAPKPKPLPKRPRADDDAIRAVIARLLPSIGPRRSAMLRHLRDVEGLACEQGRFYSLFADVVKS